MPRRSVRLLLAVLLASSLRPGESARAEGPADSPPLRGVLIDLGRATPEALAAWKGEGGTAVVVPLNESVPRDRWAALADAARAAGLALYPWVEIARNPALADAHPDWMAATGGHHDDWRRRFPGAPVAAKGEVVKAWPWVPIGYAPAFEAHRRRLEALLDGLPGPWAGVFLNDLQAGPSSCGCGNDQCRWALDYGAPATAARTPGDDAAGRLVAELRDKHPGKAVIPVWVTECELGDLPRVPGSTGLCGGVECARNDCWPRYARAWNPLLKATPGPLAVGLWSGPFGRDPAWAEAALSLFQKPLRGALPAPPERTVAVLQGWGKPEPDLAALTARAKAAKGGWVIARVQVEQSWEPRLVKIADHRASGQ
jgi:hypothetical protein